MTYDFPTDTQIRVSGHETFPLRLLWLKKAFDIAAGEDGVDRRTFHEQDAIARLGVGKNMALSMRHWAIGAGVLTDDGTRLRTTEFGNSLFADHALDPYLEHHSTLWLIHAQLVATPDAATTFFYAFNILNQVAFTRDDLVQAMAAVVRSKSTSRATPDTLKRDVEVFVRSYAPRSSDGSEDTSEPLFVELGLVREHRQSGQLEFVRGPKATLPDGVFALVLKRYWQRHHPRSPTLSVEQAHYGPGSPGRVFKLDEDSLVARLMRIADTTEGTMVWSDTAGLRQVALSRPISEIDDLELIESAYEAAKVVT